MFDEVFNEAVSSVVTLTNAANALEEAIEVAQENVTIVAAVGGDVSESLYFPLIATLIETVSLLDAAVGREIRRAQFALKHAREASEALDKFEQEEPENLSEGGSTVKCHCDGCIKAEFSDTLEECYEFLQGAAYDAQCEGSDDAARILRTLADVVDTHIGINGIDADSERPVGASV